MGVTCLIVDDNAQFLETASGLLERQGPKAFEVSDLPPINYETLDGVEELVVPHGTQTGRQFMIRGRGVPRVDGRGRGDLVVRIVVETPTDLTREQEDLLRQFALSRGEDVADQRGGLFHRFRSASK